MKVIPMRIGFVTCVKLGLEVLDEIHAQGEQIRAIVTLEDAAAPTKSGRVFVDGMANTHSANLHKTRNINDPDTLDWLRAQDLDWLLVIGWSQVVGPEVLEVPHNGCLGMHPTLLPQGRGRASIPWAIIKGLNKTGVTLFQLDEGVDTGPIVDTVEIPLDPRETASTLYLKAIGAHRELIRRNLANLVRQDLTVRPQVESNATYWPARRPADGQLLQSHSVAEMDALVRALAPPYPPAWWVDPAGRGWDVLAGTAGRSSTGMQIAAADGNYVATVFRARELTERER